MSLRNTCALLVGLLPAVAGAELAEGALDRAAVEYVAKLQTATSELNAARESIESERIPLAKQAREVEDRLIRLKAEVEQLRTRNVQADELRRQSDATADALRRNLIYISGLGRDGLKALEDSLAPGEMGVLEERLQTIKAGLEHPSRENAARAGVDAAEEILRHVESSLGGHSAEGRSLRESDNQLVSGRYVFFGPASFFQSTDGTVTGIARRRQESQYAVTHPLPEWSRERAEPLFRGERGTLLLDATGGRALRLREERGSLIDHLKRGGVVGYIILGLGAVAILISASKLTDLRKLAVDEPRVVRRIIELVSKGAEAEQDARMLQPTTRTLLEAGLRHMHKPKAVLEEHLFAHLLKERSYYERRLPLLAVIVTAAPLLGLLGTVTGMVKTFTLITVFGSGNAAKLSSGISEALVTTELGLIVAIPTLIVHGYLVQRTQKRLSLLESYSLEFVTAVEEGRAAVADPRL